MRRACADIYWVSCSDGGRKTLPQPGVMYYPHIAIDEKIERQSWSVCFLVTPISHDKTSTISFSMLVDNEETNCFFSKLCIGMDFKLLEGDAIVAVGKITSIA